MRRNNCTGLLMGLLLACRPGASYALRVSGDNPDTFFKLNMLMQPWIQLNYVKGAPTELQNDIFLRRTRFLFGGSINKWVGFFMETDMPNLGRNRAFNAEINFVQDAIVMFKLSKAFNLNVGLILPGFARDFFTSAVALHGIDYHGADTGLAYPAYPTIGPTLVWRDTGIQALGWLADEKFEYRFSISTGQVNDDYYPRLTLRLAYNLLDAEAKLFPAATYLGTKKVISVGAAIDMQPDGFRQEIPEDNTTDPPTPASVKADMYMGVAADVTWDLPMAGGRRLTGAAAFLYYKLGDDSQIGAYFDIGFGIGKFEPLILVHWMTSSTADSFDEHYFDIHAALMHWTFGHNMNLKLDIGIIKGGVSEAYPQGIEFFGDGTQVQTTIRTQMFF